jgi:hypothetical protein
MDSATEILDSADLDASLQASLAYAEASGSTATRSAVELSLDEDKVGNRHAVRAGSLRIGMLYVSERGDG